MVMVLRIKLPPTFGDNLEITSSASFKSSSFYIIFVNDFAVMFID